MYRIEIQDIQGNILAQAEGENGAWLAYNSAYRPGDVVVFMGDAQHVKVLVDQAVQTAEVFLPSRTLSFAIPFGDAANGFALQAFTGEIHTLAIEPLAAQRIYAYRSIACNPVDQRGEALCFPHAVANVETRGEAQFWARNAIDGIKCNDSHGPWPYHSWGIGERREAWLRIDFGRAVEIDKVGITLRADFPHDAWWEQGTLDCSDGTTVTLPLIKTAETQYIDIGVHMVNWVRLRELIKADDPSPFPALTQLEVFGRDAEQASLR